MLEFKKERLDDLDLIISNDGEEYKIDFLQRNIFEIFKNKETKDSIVLDNYYITSDNYIYHNYYQNYINYCSLNKYNLYRYKQMINNFSINKFVLIVEQKYLFYEIMLGYDNYFTKDVNSYIFNSILKKYLDNFKN